MLQQEYSTQKTSKCRILKDLASLMHSSYAFMINHTNLFQAIFLYSPALCIIKVMFHNGRWPVTIFWKQIQSMSYRSLFICIPPLSKQLSCFSHNIRIIRVQLHFQNIHCILILSQYFLTQYSYYHGTLDCLADEIW